MGTLLAQPPVAENVVVLGSPCLSLMWPPAKNTRPSLSRAWPAQNSHAGLGTAVKVPMAGFQTLGVPVRPSVRTRPSGNRARCTATLGQANMAVHSPEVSDDAVAKVGGAPPAGLHGVPSLARESTALPSRKSCTVPRTWVSIRTSLAAGSISGAAGRSAVPSSSVPATRYVTLTGTPWALETTKRLPQT